MDKATVRSVWSSPGNCTISAQTSTNSSVSFTNMVVATIPIITPLTANGNNRIKNEKKHNVYICLYIEIKQTKD